VLGPEKRLAEAAGQSADGVEFRGYAMHMGRTTGPATARPVLRLSDGRADGAGSPDGQVLGTYMHGLFADDAQRGAWLRRWGAAPSGHRHEAAVEHTLDQLAQHLERYIDVDRLLSLAA
jgi:adenosylcobyric acid synthase